MSRRATNKTLLDQSFVSGVNFITGLLLARFLGMESYGVFVLLYGVILFSSNIQTALIISPMMVKGPSLPVTQAGDYYSAALRLQLLITTAFIFSIITGGHLLNRYALDNAISGLIVPLSVATAGLMIQDFFRRYFFSTSKVNHALVNDILSYGLQLAGIILFQMVAGISIAACLYIMSVTSLIAVVHGLNSTDLLNRNHRQSGNNIRHTLIEHWDFSKWLVARNVVYLMGTQLVIYLTAIFLSVAAVGAMSAARNIVGIVNILFLAVDNFATPRAARAYSADGISGLKSYTKRISWLGGIITAAIALLASSVPELWLSLVYGKLYSGYGWIIVAWSVFFFIGYFQRPLGIALRVVSDTRSVFFGTLLGTIAAALCSYPAMHYFGLKGALSTLILTQLIVTTALFLSYNRLNHIPKNEPAIS